MCRLHGLLIATLLLIGIAVLPGPLPAQPSGGAAAPDATESSLIALAARAAEHGDVTRFVLDLSGPVRFTTPNSNDPNEILVDLPPLDWHIAARFPLRAIGLLERLRYEPADGGQRGLVVVTTTHPATLRKAFVIAPAAGNNYRLVLDLAAAPVIAPPTTAPPQDLAAAPGPSASAPLRATAATEAPPRVANASASAAMSHGRSLTGPIPAPSAMPSKSTAPSVATDTPPPATATQPSAPAHAHDGKPIVVIDPGHGGVDPGATSITGAYEKNIVLALAHELKAALDKDGKVTCVLTRDRDIFIPLRERVAIARAANADLFMSLHADTVSDPNIRGLSVYTLSQTSSDAEAQALADTENKSDIVAGIDLSNESPEVTNILIDLVQRESMNHSAIFAHQVIEEVAHETHQLLQNTHRFAGFAVLKAPDIPSVLVETGYLSNEHDEQMLRHPEYRAKLAAALARAIEQYFVRPVRKGHHA